MQKPKKIILFDIDYTLWHSDDFRDLVFPHLAKTLGYSLEDFIRLAHKTHQETKKQIGYFRPDIWLSLLHKVSRKEVSQEILKKILWKESFYTESLDKDVQTVLPQLQQKGYLIGIFSTGGHVFQQKKIETITHLLQKDYVYIVTDKVKKLETILHAHKNDAIVIVDDLPEVLAAVKHYNPKITTILRKSNKRYEQTKQVNHFKPDYTITRLKELVTILN